MMIGWSKAIQLECLNMIFHQDDMDFWMKSDMSSFMKAWLFNELWLFVVYRGLLPTQLHRGYTNPL